MIYIQLLLAFFKIGLFSFGGGYAMIPLIQKEIEANGWMASSEFVDIIAIAEMTPGPISVNSATFVGYKTAGLLGGMFATLGVSLPSLILIMILSRYILTYKEHPITRSLFYGIRPVIAGLIVTAAIFVAETSIFRQNISLQTLMKGLSNPLELIDIKSLLLFIAVGVSLVRFKLHPILIIIGSGIIGLFLFS
ncbi:MAG: chromate transporter [Clostridia bacterium]